MDRRLAALFAAVPVAAAGAFALNAATGDSVAQKSAPVDYIEGTVTSGKATPEAGVWVIAVGKPAGTLMRKIVVTDREGRFVLPQMADTKWQLWVRGYGLLDSAKKTPARIGADVSLKVRKARTKVQAAKIYPANYWLSMLNLPDASPDYANRFKLGCMLCHQIGIKATRLPVTHDGYDQGTKKARTMYQTTLGLGREALLNSLADWGGRIAKGETPAMAPARPKGAERNIVITQWNWGDKFAYAHDEVATDKRNPTVNKGGPVYGVDIGNDRLLIVNPKTNKSTAVKIPTRNGFNTSWCDASSGPGAPVHSAGFGTLGCPADEVGGVSAYQGKYHNPANPHNPMMDAKGRVWITTQIRREWPEDIPAQCKSDPAIANRGHHRQLGYYDPKTKKFALIDTCYGTHHLQFDKSGVLWSSGDLYVLGWFDPSKYDPARPETEATAQGHAEVKVDTNGDGVADKPIIGFNYGIIPNDVDNSVWTAQPSTGPRGLLVRYDKATGKFESYTPPAPGSGPRGVDVDSKGIIWAAMGGSGHLGRFDRSKCTQTWGDGTQCPQGWTFFKPPGPLLAQSTPADQRTADLHYYLWVDRFNTFGLGKDVVVLNGTNSDSLQIFEPSKKKWTTMRVPYPLNAYQRGLDGRIDDPTTGWKGRGLWFNDGLDPVIHNEVQHGWLGHAQMRPTPLAR